MLLFISVWFTGYVLNMLWAYNEERPTRAFEKDDFAYTHAAGGLLLWPGDMAQRIVRKLLG